MKTWKDCCEEVGYDRNAPYPKKEYCYFAYQGGYVIGKFDNEGDARSVSKIVEKVCINQEEYDAVVSERNAAQERARQVWNDALRKEYSYINDAVFDLCYSKAYSDGHSAGFDEVANYMIDYIDFALKVFAATNKGDQFLPVT